MPDKPGSSEPPYHFEDTSPPRSGEESSDSKEAVGLWEERLRAFVNASSSVVYRMSPDWRVMRELNGQGLVVDTREPRKNWLEEYVLPEDRSAVRQAIEEAIRTKTMFELEHRVRRTDGTTGWLLSRAVPILGEEGEIVEWFGAASDVTARKRAEMELREAKIYAESIVETIHEPLLVLRPDLTVRSANPAFYEHFAVREADTLGRPIYELGNGQWDIPGLRTLLEDVLPGSNVFNDYEVRHAFERIGERVMLLNARRLDHVQLILLGIRDITERNRAEMELRRSNERLTERNEVVCRLAAELTAAEQAERERIAHLLHEELQQDLVGAKIALRSFGRFTEELPEEGRAGFEEKLRECQAMIDAAIEEARSLSVELSPPVARGEGLTVVLVWLAHHMKDRYGLQVRLELQGEPSAPTQELQVLLYQATKELLFNVVKHAGVEEARVRCYVEKGALVLEVIDEGEGFDPEGFDPERLEHDRPAEEGHLGQEGHLGLASIRRRLQAVGGQLDLEARPGEGTLARVRVPSDGLSEANGFSEAKGRGL